MRIVITYAVNMQNQTSFFVICHLCFLKSKRKIKIYLYGTEDTYTSFMFKVYQFHLKGSEAEVTKTYWTVYIFTNFWQLYEYKSARETRSSQDQLLCTTFIHKNKRYNSVYIN